MKRIILSLIILFSADASYASEKSLDLGLIDGTRGLMDQRLTFETENHDMLISLSHFYKSKDKHFVNELKSSRAEHIETDVDKEWKTLLGLNHD